MSYDKFFKQAQKARGLDRGPVKKKNSMSLKISEDRRTPEGRVRAELTERIQKKRMIQNGNRNRVPWTAIVFLGLSISGGVVGYYRYDLLENLLSKVEIRVFGQAIAADGNPEKSAKAEKPSSAKGEKNTPQPGGDTEKPAETKDQTAVATAPNIKQWSTEELSFFSKLNDRKKQLDQRESELNKLEAELQKRQTELDGKIKQLETMRDEISKTLKNRVALDKQKVDKLVDVYSSMKPGTAAKVIETINEDLAVEVLDHMKKKNAAEILDLMSPKKARRLSELLTGYERSTASVDDDGSGKGTPAEAGSGSGN